MTRAALFETESPSQLDAMRGGGFGVVANAGATWMLVLLVLLTGACAEPLVEPGPPPGEGCDTLLDCSANTTGGSGQVCGAVHACVAGVCESEPSLFIACR